MLRLSVGVALGWALAGCEAAHLPGGPDGGGPDAPIVNSDATLASLEVSRGALEPSFDPQTTSYTLTLGLGAVDLELTATAQAAGASIAVAGMPVDSGATSPPIALPLGDSVVEVVVTPESGAPVTYSISINRGRGILQEAYVKASNTDAGDQLGRAVVIDGDTLAVGARLEDSGANGVNGNQADNEGTSVGAVYVFARGTDGRWSQQAYIKPSNPDLTDFFGSSLALSGDTLAVAANFEDSNAVGPGGGAAEQADNSASASGAVYIFTRAGDVWSQQAYIKASNTEASDRFGESLALDGDTLAVGAFLEDSAATGVGGDQADNLASGAGAVYVFVRDGTLWTQQAYLKASNTEANDQFGFAVALDGDTLAVGAVLEDSAATGIDGDQADNTASAAGAVYVFARDGAVWSQQAYVKASNTEANDRFGESLALDGDTLAVGADAEDSAATGIGGDQGDNTAASAGAVYVYARDGATWTQQAYLKASNAAAGDNFGSAVALDGDALAVGAVFEDSAAAGVHGDEENNAASGAGAAYVFIRRDGAWSQTAYVKASNPEPFDELGIALDLSGGTLAVGAFLEDGAGTGIGADAADNAALSAGAVYVFR